MPFHARSAARHVAVALVSLTCVAATAHAATYAVTNTNDAGAGSLRQAILSANATPGRDTIVFAIALAPGAVATIAPLTPLPPISDEATLDGYSQSGSAMNTQAAGFDAVLRIRLSGASASAGADGLVLAATGTSVRGLIIDGFAGYAVRITATASTSGVVVTGNVLGTGYGALPLAGNRGGVFVDGCPTARVGGHFVQERNVVAGNQEEGVLVGGSATSVATVRGNRIGLDAAGASAGNRYGVRVIAGGSAIGGTMTNGGNTIAANAEADIQVEAPGVVGNVQGNRIGTDDAGLASRGSTVGIRVIGATGGTIGNAGSSTIGGRNIVVASARAIELRQSTGLTVANNYICRGATGAAVGACATGVRVEGGGSHTLGGHYLSGTSRYGQGNVIANCRTGIHLTQTTGNVVEANTIEDNPGVGVLVEASSGSLVGSFVDTPLGASLGNVLRRNGSGSVPPRGGIVVLSGTSNAILRNSIVANAPIGIDLGGDGETFNDNHDVDVGANQRQNYPALFRVSVGASTQVDGMLASLPTRAYRLQFFGSPAPGTSGHVEGQTFLGETTVTTDAQDHAYWTLTLPPIGPGTVVTATATLLNDTTPADTSEFSPGLPAGMTAAPTITGHDTWTGPTEGGTALSVTGTNFFLTDTVVTLGGAEMTDVLVRSPTSLVATSPPHAPGVVDLTVRTSVGSATLPAAFTYIGTGPTDTPLMIALNRLRAASLDPLEVEFEKGLPVHISGRVPAGTASEPPWRRALDFLTEYRDLFQVGVTGSVPGPSMSDHFRPVRQHVDPDGTAHVFLQQMRDGIPLLDVGLALHFRGNDFTSSNGRWLSWRSPWYGAPVDTRPTIPFQQAFERAVAHLGGGTPGPSQLVGKPGLVVYWPDLDHDGTWTPPSTSPDEGVGPSCLAWRLTILAPGGPWDVVVDARDGTVLEATTRQRTAFNLEIFNARGQWSGTCFNWPDDPSVPYAEENGRLDRVAERADGELAYDSIQAVYDYFADDDTYDRDSYDGDGSQIEIFFNVGNDQWDGSPNASWISGPGCQIITFADGYPTLDIVGHEFTHGITADTAGLVYCRMAGAINEHMSDVFGALIDDDDWLIGDTLPGRGNGCGADRDMANPPNCITRQDADGDGNNDPFPDHTDPALDTGGIGLRRLSANQDPADSNDQGWVHTNSSIPNKAAYLVAEGGTHKGIIVAGLGREPLGLIWYRALVRYLDDRSPFRDLYWATRRAAGDLYGQASHEQCQVTNALAAVGIGPADFDCDGINNDLEEDDDGDFIPDNGDNCPAIANPDQANTDGVGQGDACDPDADNDGLLNEGDNCPVVVNPGQDDFDGDGLGDACDDSDGDRVGDATDNCRLAHNHYQTDSDGDGIGDACDADADGDGRPNDRDNCPLVANPGWADGDGDGVGDACDNCLAVSNANQANTDGDEWGDACDTDDDEDGVGDEDDVCQWVFDPQQIDMDRNGRGLRCDADEAAMLGGDLGWRALDVPNFPDSPVEIPVFPCVDDDCPGGGEPFAPGQRYTLRLAGTAQVDARIVDEAGRVVARGGRGADGQTLAFDVAPAFRAARASLPLRSPAAGRVAAALQSGAPWAPGPDEPAYFLQLRPLTSSLVGQTLHLAVWAGLHAGPDTDSDGITDNVDSCVSVANANQADADGDGLGDACDNCATTANGPARPLGFASAAQSDADGDATGDACDLPRFLAEGASSSFFDTRLALLNPAATSQHVVLQFERGDGAIATHEHTLPPMSRATLDPEALSGYSSAEFATTVQSAGPVLVDRTMSWDGSGYGSHAETAILAPAPTWYLAEGATHSGFELFYLIQNPDEARTADVEVTYLRPAGQPPLVHTYSIAPHSRFNIWVDTIDELASTDVSAVLQATNGVPIIVERAMYKSGHGRLFDAGHESAGVTAPDTSWFLAEGATGQFFDLFVLIANPGSRPARVRATYLLPSGQTLAREYDVAPQSRFNIWVDLEDPLLADTAVSTTIESINDVPVIVERAMWWGDASGWYEAHNSPGATTTGTSWGLAEGEVGGPQGTATYVLIANTSSSVGQVRVRLLFEDGTGAERTFAVAAHSRFNVDVGHEFSEARDRRFGTIVDSLGDPPARIVVERAMCTSPGGVFWAAGTNALATRLR